MKIRTTVVCLPINNLAKTLSFYQSIAEFPDPQVEEGMMILELPNLSLFLMEKDSFALYTRNAGREAHLPTGTAGLIISCAVETREAVDAILEVVAKNGGAVPGSAAIDALSGGYTGYFTDPDGHLWELVYPAQQ